MSREIKFRAFNVVTKIMIDLRAITPLALNMDTDGLFIPFSDGIILEQFTGLKDKNGVDLDWWEGDILQAIDGSKKAGVIKYSEGRYSVYDLDTDFRIGSISSLQSYGWEKIGNIHETPADG